MLHKKKRSKCNQLSHTEVIFEENVNHDKKKNENVMQNAIDDRFQLVE